MLSIFELQRKELVQETYWIKLVYTMSSEHLEVFFNMILFASFLLKTNYYLVLLNYCC